MPSSWGPPLVQATTTRAKASRRKRRPRPATTVVARLRRQARREGTARRARHPRAPVCFTCVQCARPSSVDELARARAAFLTQQEGPDPLCLRYPQLWWQLTHGLDDAARARLVCGPCAHPRVRFDAAQEVNNNPTHRAQLVAWFGAACVPELPPDLQ